MALLQKFPLKFRRNYLSVGGRDELDSQGVFDHRNRLSPSQEAVGNAISFKSITAH